MASLITSLFPCRKRRVPVVPSVSLPPSLHDGVAVASLLLQRKRPVPVAPPVPSFRSSHHGVARCIASLALQWRCRSLRLARHTTASLIASILLHRKRHGRSPCFARHMTALLIASLLLRCGARSVPLLRSSHDGVAHCVASVALQTMCACGAVGPFALLVT